LILAPLNRQNIVKSGWILVFVYLTAGFFEEALFYSDKVLAIEPENLEALDAKSDSLMCLGRGVEAIECFTLAAITEATFSTGPLIIYPPILLFCP